MAKTILVESCATCPYRRVEFPDSHQLLSICRITRRELPRQQIGPTGLRPLILPIPGDCPLEDGDGGV